MKKIFLYIYSYLNKIYLFKKIQFILYKLFSKNKKVLNIDIQLKPKEFVKQVAKCDFILSSAMHGLICADSLGIPNKHIILSNNVTGGDYKFRDYYSIYKNFKYKPIFLENEIINNKSIDDYKNEYSITLNDINEIYNNLEIAFRNFNAIRDLK